MLYKAKSCGKAQRIKTSTGDSVKVQMLIKDKIKDVIVEPNFPAGLLADGAPLDGKILDVVKVSPKKNNQKEKYILLGWNNQHDVIKAELVMNLVHNVSQCFLESIPWEQETEDISSLNNSPIEFLEKIYEIETFRDSDINNSSNEDKNNE